MKNIFIKFKITPDFESINTAVDKTVIFFEGILNCDKKLFSMEIILKELLNNIAVHGFEENLKIRNKYPVNVKIEYSKNNINIEVKDKCKAWSLPLQKSLKKESNELYNTSGRGVGIIDELSDYYILKRVKNFNVSTVKIAI